MTGAERIGRNIRLTRRGIADLSQEAVAERAEIHRTSLPLYEWGEREPRLETFLRIAGALSVEPGVLLEGVRWVPGIHGPGSFVVEDGR